MSDNFVMAYWPVLCGSVIALIWLIRLEAKVLYLERDRKEHWTKIDDMQKQLQEIATLLARLEGRLESKLDYNS